MIRYRYDASVTPHSNAIVTTRLISNCTACVCALHHQHHILYHTYVVLRCYQMLLLVVLSWALDIEVSGLMIVWITE